jgi:nitroreductase
MSSSSSFLANAAACFRALAKSRHSTKRFEVNRTIPSSILNDIVQTTVTSPSGFNLQPTHVVLVSSGELKSQLSENAMLGPGNAFRTRDCSVLAVFICDVQLHKRIPRILQLEREAGLRDANYLASFPVVTSFLLSGETSATSDGLVSGGIARTIKRVATDLVSPIKPAPTMESVEAWCKNVEDIIMIPVSNVE